MIKNSQGYLIKAVAILKMQNHLLLIPLAFLSLGYIPVIAYKSGQNNDALFILTAISRLGLTLSFPILFGKYIDFISDERKRSVIDIIKQNYWDYFLVSIILNLPGTMLSMLEEVIQSYYLFYVQILWEAGVDIISIYMIPLVFYKMGKIPSLVLGGKCLIGNLKFSLPIVSIVVLNYCIMTLFVYLQNSSTVFVGRDTAKLLLGGGVGLFSIAISVLVFISAALVLKDVFFTTNSPMYNKSLEKDAS